MVASHWLQQMVKDYHHRAIERKGGLSRSLDYSLIKRPN
jgi:hypothetical protein